MIRSRLLEEVKLKYRGHEIKVNRESNMSGEDTLFYSVFRVSDGYEVITDFTFSDASPQTYAEGLKTFVDNEFEQ